MSELYRLLAQLATARTRRDVIPTYVELLQRHRTTDIADHEVSAFNRAIAARWSQHALDWIKREAWKRVDS